MKSKTLKKKGRPFLKPELRKNLVLPVRFTASEKAGLVKRAVKNSQNLSEWVRGKLLNG